MIDIGCVHVSDFLEAEIASGIDAVIIRTLPNESTKMLRNYSGQNPPYLEPEICRILCKKNIHHLLVDLPSLDPEQDEGKLLAHKEFWGKNPSRWKESTITELAFIPNSIKDGVYLLNLQVINLQMDAAPSRPILYDFIVD